MKTAPACLFGRVALLALLPALGLACSSSTPSGAHADGTPDAAVVTPPAPAADAGGFDAALDALPDAPPPCNDLVVAAPSVDYSLSDQASPPAATGGPIADGTYYLTAYTIYGAGSVGSGFTANQATSVTLDIAGDAWSQVQVITIESTVSTVATNLTVATSGASITLTPSCPSGPATSGTYSATATALQVVTQTSGFVLSETFAKQ